MLVEGNSLLITLSKNIQNEENRFRRINVRKITSIKKISNSPINTVKFNLMNVNKLDILSKMLENNAGNSNIELEIQDSGKKLKFKLKNKRKVDRKSINLIKNKDISALIN